MHQLSVEDSGVVARYTGGSKCIDPITKRAEHYETIIHFSCRYGSKVHAVHVLSVLLFMVLDEVMCSCRMSTVYQLNFSSYLILTIFCTVPS